MMNNDYPYRLNSALKEKLMPLCLNDQLFCTLYGGLKEVEGKMALSPEEVWLEALRLAHILGNSERPDIGYRMICSSLLQRYAKVVETDGNIAELNKRDTHNTCCIVLATLLYMFATKGDATEEGVHKQLCVDITQTVMKMPVFKAFCQKVRQCEDEEEKAGRAIKDKDYMKEQCPNLMCAEINADELVEMLIASNNPHLMGAFIFGLSHYSDMHAHCLQPQVNRLHERLNALNEQANSVRQVHEYNISGGQNLIGNEMNQPQFGMKKLE